MDHRDALREMSVEKYLLGELSGEVRDRFEEHLFDCELCAADLKSGVAMLEGARTELSRGAQQPMRAAARRRRLFSSAWLAPALAASLIAIAYQSLVLVPHMRQQLAQAESPAIVDVLTLTGGATRGTETPHISAPAHGSFLLSVDIPAQATYAGYVCSLYSPSGTLVWHGSVSADQARDTVEIRVPSAATAAGLNTLLIQGQSQPGAEGAKLVDLARRTFIFEPQR